MKTRRFLLPVVLGAATVVVLSCREPLPLGPGSSDLVGATVTEIPHMRFDCPPVFSSRALLVKPRP